ncbi:hypothetical protein HYT56_01415 [Candidatus Woesearchaeota archaeon]|nr:hypothetical protein [Candidatus Woesearchaeota archaeon]
MEKILNTLVATLIGCSACDNIKEAIPKNSLNETVMGRKALLDFFDIGNYKKSTVLGDGTELTIGKWSWEYSLTAFRADTIRTYHMSLIDASLYKASVSNYRYGREEREYTDFETLKIANLQVERYIDSLRVRKKKLVASDFGN